MYGNYDVIVVGGGHAGCEATSAAARLGCKTALITGSIKSIGVMSCNPSIGGIAKGIVVREIDALGGLMGKTIDKASIHSRILNLSRGPAVWGPRAQADRELYRDAMQSLLFSQNNLEIIEAIADDLIIENNIIKGIIIDIKGKKEKIHAKSVVLATGTFLGGVMYMGAKDGIAQIYCKGGRVGENYQSKISEKLASFNFTLGRLRTGTPPRLAKDSIDFSAFEVQKGDDIPIPFSYETEKIDIPQINCYTAITNLNTHQIVEDNLQYTVPYGKNEGSPKGPRYCPSFETKIVRFKDKKSHSFFIEPEGLDSDLIYPSGMSLSLPAEIQLKLMRSIKGLEKVEIPHYGYEVNYNYIDPRELKATLETKKIKGLFFAGQINGTTGYEEAGGQGIIAGINAGLSIEGKSFILDETNSYIGIMIRDLTCFGNLEEPYRLFTSRAEYRLLLRSDNADRRLTKLANEYGLISQNRINILNKKEKDIATLKEILRSYIYTPNNLQNLLNVHISFDGVKRNVIELIRTNSIQWSDVITLCPNHDLSIFDKYVQEAVMIDEKYHSYIVKQERDIQLLKQEENLKIPDDLDYTKIRALSSEAIDKLTTIRPHNIKIAKTIPGITPAAVMAIIIAIRNIT
ncbi:MAG: tRNA uridine-5-carboxymethylaminomethyl(34) synthesis enzyme MnmG [Anaplasmataceae bacterium]|nr:tRNA uridine-5-carboxymethylaminomethyl(34) synthesis enzyme MnmG [Anaplasmataceae bacterium]